MVQAELDEPRYLVIARTPSGVRELVKQRVSSDPAVARREEYLFEKQRSVSPPKGDSRP